MSNVMLTDLELQAIWDNIIATRSKYRRVADDVPTAHIVDNLEPVLTKIIERRLTAARQWVGGRDA